MYLTYIDESGRHYWSDPEDFVLASLTINEAYWQEIDNKVKAIKIKHLPSLPDDDIELHVKEMMKKKGIFKPLPMSDVWAILDDVFQLVYEEQDKLCIIASVIRKDLLRKKVDVELWGFRFLIERINRYLEKANAELRTAGASPQYGIMIIDSVNKGVDQRIRNKVTEMLKKGTYFSRLDYLIEDPLFTDSKWRNLNQLADCIAFCVRRKYKRGVSNSFKQQKWEQYYALIEPALDKSDTGTINGYGIKLFP